MHWELTLVVCLEEEENAICVPMISREPMCHLLDCYFCMTKIDGITRKNKSSIAYPDVPSTIRPVPHSEDLLVPVPLEILDITSGNDSSGDSNEYILPPDNNSPQLIDQDDLDDLIRNLNLPNHLLSLCLSIRLSVAKEAEMECGIRIWKNVCIYVYIYGVNQENMQIS
ncbi:hypothetical protein LOD99_12074 [Oopsacas minuta]|uniref:Uncharacterized protein n=1 Tax=Oopsacas minuta TaxID=111878 RepID=A0AAV7JIJ8_9METZ|nr:hypothetical protein LOD99_12074 [Oopsacas minuta]